MCKITRISRVYTMCLTRVTRENFTGFPREIHMLLLVGLWKRSTIMLDCGCLRDFCMTSFSCYEYEELVVQNLRRKPHSSVMVRRFRKLNSCCYVIAIPSGWHRCPNPNCNERFWSKKRELCTSPSRFLHTVSRVYNQSANRTRVRRV